MWILILFLLYKIGFLELNLNIPWVDLSAVIIALTALIATLHFNWRNQQFQKKNLQPLLYKTFGATLNEKQDKYTLNLTIDNSGLGPAILSRLELFHANNVLDSKSTLNQFIKISFNDFLNITGNKVYNYDIKYTFSRTYLDDINSKIIIAPQTKLEILRIELEYSDIAKKFVAYFEEIFRKIYIDSFFVDIYSKKVKMY